jgi:hypothetical protein
MVFFIAAIDIVLAASFEIFPPKTAQRLIAIVLIVTRSTATPSPGIGTAFPAAAATAWL